MNRYSHIPSSRPKLTPLMREYVELNAEMESARPGSKPYIHYRNAADHRWAQMTERERNQVIEWLRWR